ncbi:type I restriction-modification system subunit M [Lactococcus hodotermopsidis]|uniref:site-specific DNA-methyltransferase (adenine-specific) n=1 Tax=Pseudolactococcus hodotermopsidis TaxID=2709157 RepID=A0A6A0B8M5_9LACT|nr:type I restriction-modification system subunit M [Lactococcus hodotermopsidis]GFH41760.1 type I restriction-modification system subunit M [Lactococcus hodotermopsidis]
MNKQQLASKIWASANEMRSKIEANEYKDYILGFVFYKFLSDKEVRFLKENDYDEEDIKNLTEEDEEQVKFIQQNIGYFISYDNLFSTWIEKGIDFNVSDVHDALSAFSRLINSSHKKVFDGIFTTLETGLTKLGDSAASQTKAISSLIQLIKVIPMNGKQDYDVLGFIYEYLISMFAANAGKKAGEFYTPHEVSLLMSEIVANHVKDRDEIKIYDPTSGSGSLLINIGQSVAKHINDENNIKYYAQELKGNTYNLTRMNLVMRGVLPDNIMTRNGDTLEEDWPFFDDNDPVNTYDPLYVDAVVSNPPYSQKWDPSNKDNDPRYAEYGLAPKTKADYAFLLHDLFHIKSNGIMTIVLPHGVLFRGGEEGEIRKNLIEKDKIDAIIGLPANIFFGTSIPTIILVLKQQRENDDVLIVDASKGFIKEGKNNKLQASDIKKIVDTVINREKIEKYSRVVTKNEIRENDYNLNIPRYIDSAEANESWDIYATMFGGIPKSEINRLNGYWEAFPNLKQALFEDNGSPYVTVKVDNVKQAILANKQVKSFTSNYKNAFKGLREYLVLELIDESTKVKIPQEETRLSHYIFDSLNGTPLVDKYQAYQVLDDEWQIISIDLEMIQTEGFGAVKKVDENIVIKKKDGKDTEVQDGFIGHILPFDLVQKSLLSEELLKLTEKQNRLLEIVNEYSEIIESFSEEEKDSSILNDSNDAFVTAEVNKQIKEIYSEVSNLEIDGLNAYSRLLDAKAKKAEQLDFIAQHTEVAWHHIESKKDKTYAKAKVNAYLKQLQAKFSFPEDSFEAKVVIVSDLMAEEKRIKAEVKKADNELHLKTKVVIESLSDDEASALLSQKWISPIVNGISELPDTVLNKLVSEIAELTDKYAVTYADVTDELVKVEQSLIQMIGELDGSDFDIKGLSEFQSLIKGE